MSASQPEILTDAYFSKTKAIVESFGDKTVTYAIFMRRPVITALQLAIDWLEHQVAKRQQQVKIHRCYRDGEWVGSGEVLLTYQGSYQALVELETGILQRIGPACVAAYNAYMMASELPQVGFIAMDARHCAGREMAKLMAFAAAIGSERARLRAKARGFLGTANDENAHFFKNNKGMGTMPHGLIGYAGSTLAAAIQMDAVFPEQPLTVLVDYFGAEISDSLAVAAHFPKRVADGSLSLRIDTIGGRYLEQLDHASSYAIIERHAPEAIHGYRTAAELKHIIGPGVSAAAVWQLRTILDQQNLNKIKIVASSGFSPEKCHAFALAKAPVDVIGTGSYLPERWHETYATADIIEYDGVKRVKAGREFLFNLR